MRDFRARLTSFIRARVRSPEDAEDIAQEVMLRLHQRLATLRDGEKLASWLFQIARHAIVDHYRRRSRSPEVNESALRSDEAGDDPVLDVPAVAQGGFTERDASACLEAFVRRLEPKYREPLTAVDIDGLTHRDVAQRTGLSVPGVKSRVQRARAQLRAALRACCAFDFSRDDGLVEWTPDPAAAGCGTRRCGRGEPS